MYVVQVAVCWLVVLFFFQAEDGIRDLVRSRGLGDVYKRQGEDGAAKDLCHPHALLPDLHGQRRPGRLAPGARPCLLYTSDAADDLLCVDLGGRRLIKKKTQHKTPEK